MKISCDVWINCSRKPSQKLICCIVLRWYVNTEMICPTVKAVRPFSLVGEHMQLKSLFVMAILLLCFKVYDTCRFFFLHTMAFQPCKTKNSFRVVYSYLVYHCCDHVHKTKSHGLLRLSISCLFHNASQIMLNNPNGKFEQEQKTPQTQLT